MTGGELRGRLAGVHEEMPLWVADFLGARGLTWQQLERGELWSRPGEPPGELPFADVRQLQQYLILADPVRFAECCFVELQKPGRPPWRLWDYQKASARYRGNTLHQCAAEVGKTREIVILHLWEALTSRGDSLIAAALDGHLALIWREIWGQAQANPWLGAQVDWRLTHVKPYRDFVLSNGNTIFLRPVGIDGSALRGVHVDGRASMDEATKVKSDEAFGNFFSRATPGAEVRLYSTPDGDRECPFYHLCSRQQEVDPLSPPPPAARGAGGDPAERTYAKYRWSKDMQPAPFWTPERELQFVEEYGGRDSSTYQQNVLGHWGDPAATVFPWQRLSACLRYVPDYVVVKLLLDGDQLYVEAWRLNPAYQVRAALGDEAGQEMAAPLVRFHADRRPAGELTGAGDRRALVDRWEELLRPLVAHLAGRALAGGNDYGSVNDPTEIFFGEPIGDVTRIVARVQLKRFDYEQQEAAIRALNRILRPRHGWAGDSTGVGSAIEHYLARPLGEERMDYTGIVFNATTIDRDERTGEPLLDPEDSTRERRVSWKELGTRLLEAAVQRQRWELPYDPDIVLQWSSHTAKLLASGRRQFAHTNDHTIDANRALALRLYLLRVGELGSPPLEFAVPAGSRRASFALQEAF